MNLGAAGSTFVSRVDCLAGNLCKTLMFRIPPAAKEVDPITLPHMRICCSMSIAACDVIAGAHLRAASMKSKSLQNSVSERGTVVESFFCQLSSQLGSHLSVLVKPLQKAFWA